MVVQNTRLWHVSQFNSFEIVSQEQVHALYVSVDHSSSV